MEKFFQHLLDTFVGVAAVWFAAWLFDPNIDSGMVWILAMIFGWIHADIQEKN